MTHEEPRVAKVPTDDFAVPGGNPAESPVPAGASDDASAFVFGTTLTSELFPEQSLGVAADSPTAGTSRPTSPYKELDYFVEQDQSRFAGRKRDIHEVLARIETSRALVLYGRSGLGKTSLLLAGVFPELRERSYRPVYVRTLEDPLDDLRRAIAQQCELPDANTDLRGLLLAAGSGGQTPVLVLDQFEEFFTRFKDRPRDRAAFVREVAAVITDAAVDVRVLFSLREDFLAAVDDFLRRLPELFSNSYRLPPLSAFGA
jgi:AAA+ ATPase superfamily predicted ATPase